MKKELQNKPDQVIKLGKKIIEELNLQHSVDTLSRWLSHYLAELLIELNECPKDVRKSKEKECVDIILKIWDNRESLGINPMKNISTALSILEVITSSNETFQSYRHRPRIIDDVFAEFAQVADSSVNDIIYLTFVFSVANEKFSKLKAWKDELPETLSSEDKTLINSLDILLGRFQLITFSNEEESTSISELAPEKRQTALIQKLEDLIENQKKALENLKVQLKK